VTLHELRQKGILVGGERPCPTGGGGRQVLIRCGCLKWQWVRASRVEFKVSNGHVIRCDRCSREARKKVKTTESTT
jgi:hypothetical protein